MKRKSPQLALLLALALVTVCWVASLIPDAYAQGNNPMQGCDVTYDGGASFDGQCITHTRQHYCSGSMTYWDCTETTCDGGGWSMSCENLYPQVQ